MRPHEKLDVWQKAIDLVVEVYKATEHFPKEEKFGLTSQVRRARIDRGKYSGRCWAQLQ